VLLVGRFGSRCCGFSEFIVALFRSSVYFLPSKIAFHPAGGCSTWRESVLPGGFAIRARSNASDRYNPPSVMALDCTPEARG
jgi:hypothetical protein